MHIYTYVYTGSDLLLNARDRPYSASTPAELKHEPCSSQWLHLVEHNEDINIFILRRYRPVELRCGNAAALMLPKLHTDCVQLMASVSLLRLFQVLRRRALFSILPRAASTEAKRNAIHVLSVVAMIAAATCEVQIL